MKIGTMEMFRDVDKYCIETLNIPGIVLMENAALKVIKNIDLKKYNSFTIVSGRGNNGGDGLAVARHLFVLGKNVDIYLVGSGNMSEDCSNNYNILKNMNVNIYNIKDMKDISQLSKAVVKNEITVDALFGTGLSRNVEGIFEQVINVMNENSRYILSIDVPSGFQCNEGKILGNCVRANKTVSFVCYKRGFINYDANKFTGDIVIENIGVPQFAVDKFHGQEFISDKEMIKQSLKVREKYAHKGEYGRVTIIAGSKGFTGSAYLASQAAVKTGAGLVTLGCSSDIQEILSTKVTETMTVSLEDERFLSILEKSDAVAVGPGMGNNNNTFKVLNEVLSKSKCPVVIDADGLNVLQNHLDILMGRDKDIILTPHLGEMSRITGLEIECIKENRLEVSKNFAKKYGVILLLKGFNTIITDGTTTIINSTGNSAMASGGMGDCLTGMISAMIGQGYKAMEAVYIAAYIHGYCGDRLSETMATVNASSVIERIPYIMKELQSE